MAPSYDPSEARMRVAFQPDGAEHIFDPSATWHDHRFTAEEIGAEQTLIESASLNPGGQKTQGSPGKIRTGPAPVNVELEPEGMAPYFAVFQRRRRNAIDLGGGAWRHWLAPEAADVDMRSRRLQLQLYRDDTAIQQAYGAAVAGFSFGTQVDQMWTGNFSVVAERADYWGVPNQLDGTTTDPIVRGLARLELIEDAQKLRVRIADTNPPEGDVSVEIAIDNDAYGASPMFVTFGQWARAILSSDGSGVGKPPSHVELLWPEGTNDLAQGNEWEIPIRVETPWVASLPGVRALPEVETELFLNGAPFPGSVTSISLDASHTAEPDLGVGGVWPTGTLMSGQRTILWQLDRRMVDNFLQRRLEAGVAVHLDVVITSPFTIGSSGVPYRVRFVSPNCLLNGTRPTITDPNTQRESYQLNAYPAIPDAEGFSDDLTVVLDNGTATYG